ncbi:MAG: ribonuclease PH [Candidatus Abyssubacteria bacterium]
MNNSSQTQRPDGRNWDQMRTVHIQKGYSKYAEGSALITIGNTTVICAASVEEKTPEFLRDTGKGWITAEYAMLPRSTHTRTNRGPSGRSYEIQRLVGRALRSVTDLVALGPRTIIIDCDVLQADGGTRTAAITGSFVALHEALSLLVSSHVIETMPITEFVAATSVGLVEGVPMLDLCYDEDSRAQADLNVVMSQSGGIIEVQGTAEKAPFERQLLDAMLNLAHRGIRKLVESQMAALGVGSRIS